MKNKDTQKTLEAEILNCKKRLKELAPFIEEDEENAENPNVRLLDGNKAKVEEMT